VEVFRVHRGFLHRAETFEITPSFQRVRQGADVVKTRSYVGVSKTGGWEVAEESEMLESAERIATKPWR